MHLALLVFPAFMLGNDPSRGPSVQTSLGELRGATSAGVPAHEFLGIPYAAAPVGALRWRAPRPPSPWRSPRDATRFGSACLQMGTFQGPWRDGVSYDARVADSIGEVVGSEDCLTLNVWRPATTGERHPVIVFVHGGSNVAGFSGDPLYHGARLAARANAVVVTLNYRLGVFGFFSHPALRDEGGEENLGLRDIVRALEWVRDEISAFGGDSSNVTLMGQSAGAMNTYALLVAPRARGLFHRAIALSGTLLPMPRERTDAYAQRVVDAYQRERGPLPTPLAPTLWGADARALVRATSGSDGAGFSTADGDVLPHDVDAAIRDGRVNAVPLLAGVTRDEGKFFAVDAIALSPAERARRHLDGAHISLGEYLAPSWRDRPAYMAHVAPTTRLVHGLHSSALQRLSGRVPYLQAMRFDWDAASAPWDVILGATHGSELPFLFGTWKGTFYQRAADEENRKGREGLSAMLMDVVATFARTGRAAVPDSAWPEWTPTSRATMLFGGDATTASVQLSRE